MRQFRLRQNILDDLPNLDKLHDIDMRGGTNISWPYHHSHWINKWNYWNDYIVQCEINHGILHENSEYIQWYIR